MKILKSNLILFIFLISLLVRLVGTKPGFPPFHPDEGTGSYSRAIYMFFHYFKPNSFDYPAGVPFLHLLIYKTIFLPMVFLKMFFPHPRVLLTAISLGNQFLEEFQGEIFGPAGIKAMFWSRYLAATIGALCIPLLYLTGKKLFNSRAGLFAAFFLAFNFRHVLGSHFGLPDVHNSFFSLLAFYASLLLLEKNSKKRYFFAGLTCGLTFSIKYQTFCFLPFFFVHLIWAFRKRSFKYLFRVDFLKACFLSFLVFLIINPYFFFNLEAVIREAKINARWYRMGRNQLTVYPYFYLYHWGIGHLPSLAVVLGLFLMPIFSLRKFLLISSFVLLFFWIMTYFSSGGDYTRNFITPMPLLLLFAGYFLEVLYQLLKKLKLPAWILMVILLFYFNFTSAKNSLILAYYYAQPWNFNKLSQWFEEKMPQGVKIRAYPLYMHYTLWQNKNIEMLDWSYSQGPHSLAEFQEEGTDFAILNSHSLENVTYYWRTWPAEKLFAYNHVPFDFIESSFYGLSVRELMNYTVHEIYKPWQAASEYNFLVFKIPPKTLAIGQRIAFFGFDKKEDLWEVRSTFGFNPIKAKWSDQEGKEKPGSLVINSGGVTTSRLASRPIEVKPGKLYTVRGWLKNSSDRPGEEKESFLRIDFYPGKSEAELDKPGMAVALSARAPVNDKWVQREVSLIAPKGTDYLTISFQRKEPRQEFVSLLDEVEVFESDVLPSEKFMQMPYLVPEIPLESLYGNSFL